MTDSSPHEEAVDTEEQHHSQPADFQPLFGLIEDESTGNQHHPHIHYIFADDDDDLVTNAAIHALKASSSVPVEDDPHQNPDSPKERFILLDLDPSTSKVVSAQSLSPEWQITATDLSVAPSFQDHENALDGGMMLRIRGVVGSTSNPGSESNPTAVFAEARTQANDSISDAMFNLADRFQYELDTIQKLMLQWDAM